MFSPEIGNLRPASNYLVARQAPEEKKLLWMNIMCTIARVVGVGVASDKNHNPFLVRSDKKDAHHWFRLLL